MVIIRLYGPNHLTEFKREQQCCEFSIVQNKNLCGWTRDSAIYIVQYNSLQMSLDSCLLSLNV